MTAFAPTLLIYYIAIVAVFCIYGVHRYGLVWTWLRTGGRRAMTRGPEADAPRDDPLPRVTVQLPMYNEGGVADRIIRAACALDYPRDRLQIQVLDDSTDECADLARRCCERLADAGHDVQHLHRDVRTGFKAGALAAGLASATGDLVAIFDADFVPPPDCLRRTVGDFDDERVGLVQMRWGHLNRGDSLLTEVQALCLDGHFLVEQAARARTGRWFNFNGTAGIWRRACIDDAGGWTHDTLTEDTDLSYRAQLAGWRFRYREDVVCPAELPTSVSALMSQQHRWTKGLIQNAFKLLPTILRSDTPRAARLELLLHLTSPLPYAAMLLLTLMTLPAFFIGLPATGISPHLAVGLGVGALALGTLAAATFVLTAQWAQGRPLGPAALRLPALMAIGIGVSYINARAIAEAVLGMWSPFVRTPKRGEANTVAAADPAGRLRIGMPPGSVETGLGAIMVLCMGLCVTQPTTLVGLPFVALFAAGYLGIGVPRLLETIRATPAPGPLRLVLGR